MKTLGIDIGTTSVCAVVYDDVLGEVAAKTASNDAFLPGAPWERIQDPALLVETSRSLARQMLRDYPDIAALGVTGQMHGILYLNDRGEPVSPLYTWQDGRGDLERGQGLTWVQDLSRRTGYPLATGYGMVTHGYNRDHGLVPGDAVVFCTIADYVAMALAGQTRPVMDATNAASLGLFSPGLGWFDPQALALAEIDPALIPAPAGREPLGVGELGVPVYPAIGDNQAAFLGASGGDREVLLANVGTGSQIALFTGEFLQVPGMETRPYPGGGWLLVGAALCGGRSYALLENFFRQTAQMADGFQGSAYPGMERLLDQAGPVSGWPKAVTTFQGTRQNPTLRGSITGIGTDNFTPVHLMYSIMEGMARELYEPYRNYLDRGGKAPARLIGSGNGLGKNRHLRQMFRQVFQMELTMSSCREEAACGAAMLAAQRREGSLRG